MPPGRPGQCTQISIHALREEGDEYPLESSTNTQRISIHALREEGDHSKAAGFRHRCIFLSTPSARRATCCFGICDRGNCDFYPRPPRGGRPKEQMWWTTHLHFYPRPPRGGRPGRRCGCDPYMGISIHALREEGDPSGWQMPARSRRFLSTPSARRATRKARRSCAWLSAFLSTPSARRATEGTHHPIRRASDFYPRPPRGGRPLKNEAISSSFDFYPRPPRGGRREERV